MISIDQTTLTVIGLVITNLTILVGAYVNIRVTIAKLETMVEKLTHDVNTLGDLYRSINKAQE
jgi:hypothetical protein